LTVVDEAVGSGVAYLANLRPRHALDAPPTPLNPDTDELEVRVSKGDTLRFLTDLPKLRALVLDGARSEQLQRLGPTVRGLATLVLRRPTFDDLTALSSFRGLRALGVLDATKLETLVGVDAFRHLRVLLVRNAPRLTSLEPLREAVGLTEFMMATLVSRTKPQLVDSLAPLGGLRELEYLRFEGVVARARDLWALSGLHELREIAFPNYYPVREVGRLAARCPRSGASPPTTRFGEASRGARSVARGSAFSYSAARVVGSCASAATGPR
jgi:hypothetical protein